MKIEKLKYWPQPLGPAAQVTGLFMVTPEPGLPARACIRYEFEDGTVDYVPLQDVREGPGGLTGLPGHFAPDRLRHRICELTTSVETSDPHVVLKVDLGPRIHENFRYYQIPFLYKGIYPENYGNLLEAFRIAHTERIPKGETIRGLTSLLYKAPVRRLIFYQGQKCYFALKLDKKLEPVEEWEKQLAKRFFVADNDRSRLAEDLRLFIYREKNGPYEKEEETI